MLRILKWKESVFNIRKLYKKKFNKYQKNLFLSFQIININNKCISTCISIFNEQNAKEKIVKLSTENKNNNREQCLLHEINSKQTNEHFQKMVKEKNNERPNNKKDQEKVYGKTIFEKKLTIGAFNTSEKKNKDTYLECLRMYESHVIARRDIVTFITVALKYMKEFGVHKDITVYKKLLDLFPKGKMIPTNIFQSMFMHYGKEQNCAIDIFEQMEDNGVIPDLEMEAMLLNIFGRHGLPTQKYWKMMYWMPKFKNLNPWPVPKPIPDDVLELAKLAMIKISSIDVRSSVTIYETVEIEDSIEKTWIVSAMSPKQSELLTEHNKNIPIYIEGPFRIYVAIKAVDYFILKAKPPQNRKYPDYEPDGKNLMKA
jgi:signaling intermediate in Toll pathway protein